MVAAETRFRLCRVPHRPAYLDHFGHLGDADGGGGKIIAVGLVFILFPACADAKDDASARELLQRRSHLWPTGRGCGSSGREQ